MIVHYLRQCRNLDRIINIKLEQIKTLEDISTKISAANSKEIRSGVSPSDVVGKIVPRIADLRSEVNRDIDNLFELREKVMLMIDKIPDVVSQELLTYRYISAMKWTDVAERMNYDYSHTVHVLHPKALKLFEFYNNIQ